MENNIIWTCKYCHINPSAQLSGKCPRCGRKLIPWDLSKAPLERQSEWPVTSEKRAEEVDKANKYTDYTKYSK